MKSPVGQYSDTVYFPFLMAGIDDEILLYNEGRCRAYWTAPLSLLTLNSIDNIVLHRYYFLNLRKSDILNRKRRISSFIVQNITIYAT